ncbi:inducible nitrate reductase 2 [Hypoxylon sp. NC1633]|nr:inducible nitrate reductase 2 [Hypoxylon sp. NC1633]
MKRILALHGVGSSGAILKDQLAPLTRELGSEYEFVYFDGAIERERGPGMAPYYPGPFYSYTTGYSTAEVSEAMEDLDQFIEDNGPFDGVFGFSQGASMAATYLLDHYAREPEAQPPFDFAVLFSSVAAFSPDETCCGSVIADLMEQDYPAVQTFPDAVFSKLSKLGRLFAEYLALTFTVAKQIGAVSPDQDIAFFKQRNMQDVPRVLHPSLTEDRIKVPTVHVIGKADLPAMVAQSRLVSGLCDQSLARVHYHSGGHGIPAKRTDVKPLLEMIEWATTESANRRALYQALTGIAPRQVL